MEFAVSRLHWRMPFRATVGLSIWALDPTKYFRAGRFHPPDQPAKRAKPDIGAVRSCDRRDNDERNGTDHECDELRAPAVCAAAGPRCRASHYAHACGFLKQGRSGDQQLLGK